MSFSSSAPLIHFLKDLIDLVVEVFTGPLESENPRSDLSGFGLKTVTSTLDMGQD